MLVASAENRNTIVVNEKHLSDSIVSALQEGGFLLKISDAWLKITLKGILNGQEIVEQLLGSSWPDHAKETINNILSVLHSMPTQSVLLEIEKWLWPLKIKEIDIPVFVVPIRPEWAMHLFDMDIARQDLFGSEPSLILNSENVYYRSSFPKVLSAPGRVLWYVSAGDGRYQGARHLRAISYLDDVEIGKPKQLFSKYKKLGIYNWKDVFDNVAGGDLDGDIMAFKFSKTEIFRVPISYQKLQEIWTSNGRKFNPIAPLSIDKERFITLYNMGTKGQ